MTLTLGLVCLTSALASEPNLLRNPGFETAQGASENPQNWSATVDSASKVLLATNEAHGGQYALLIAANSSVEQRVEAAPAGAYLARAWVKSEKEQAITFLVRNPVHPWTAYNCAEVRVPAGRWTQIETFCAVDQDGPLSVALGGVSNEFHLYHGTGQDMLAPILVDDFELVRYEPKPRGGQAGLAVWDAGKELGPDFAWAAREHWSQVDDPAHTFVGTPVIQARHLAITVRPSDGGMVVYAIGDGQLRQRCILVPSPALSSAKCALVKEGTRRGVRVEEEGHRRSYIAWFGDHGLIQVAAQQVLQFRLQDCQLRYGILPSFAGTDLCYNPAELAAGKPFRIPSTQWLVGLVDGSDSMLVAAWETNTQPVSLETGSGEKRLITAVTIGTEQGGFAVSLVEHKRIWHRQPLNEDWLGEYQTIDWERPFPARWMSHFYVSPGGHPNFREPDMNYSFPMANAKTRMWGVWFEDWNHYPFFFEGEHTVFHFEKTFIPQGDALIYFLEPAAADLFSPCEIVQEFLGREKSASLFDFEANGLRKLKYSTPDQFMFDRPVCATTTRLSKIKQEEKPTVGVELATHLFEFVREIRSRVDQYRDFFSQTKNYIDGQEKAHPEMSAYLAELLGLVSQAQERSDEIYATPLSAVQQKVDAMKLQLQEGKGDGFDCGKLDVRGPAGAQDDLCRRYNRRVLKLVQVAAFKCGDSPEKAVVAQHLWEESRKILRQPTRWEPRRTLYFFEP